MRLTTETRQIAFVDGISYRIGAVQMVRHFREKAQRLQVQ